MESVPLSGPHPCCPLALVGAPRDPGKVRTPDFLTVFLNFVTLATRRARAPLHYSNTGLPGTGHNAISVERHWDLAADTHTASTLNTHIDTLGRSGPEKITQ